MYIKNTRVYQETTIGLKEANAMEVEIIKEKLKVAYPKNYCVVLSEQSGKNYRTVQSWMEDGEGTRPDNEAILIDAALVLIAEATKRDKQVKRRFQNAIK